MATIMELVRYRSLRFSQAWLSFVKGPPDAVLSAALHSYVKEAKLTKPLKLLRLQKEFGYSIK